MPTVDEMLNDATPWTLVDIMRELRMSAGFAAQYAFRSQTEPDTGRSFPAALPGLPPLPLSRLLCVANGDCGPDSGPSWPAGSIRAWARRCARMDQEFNLIRARPPSRPGARAPRRRQP